MNDLFLLAIILAVIIGTPGPNNTVLLLSGLNKGYKDSLRLLFAINFGVVSMIAISSVAVDYISSIFTTIENYLWTLSILLLIYIGYKMWPKKSSSYSQNTNNTDVAMLFFQFLNPKIWLASITVATTFQGKVSVFFVITLTAIIGLSLNSLWIISGTLMRKINFSFSNEVVSKMGAIILFLSALFLFFNYLL